MGNTVYRENFTLDTDIIDFDLETSGGWTPDCQRKQDYDPCFVRGDSRVYPNGSYICVISIGANEIIRTDVLKAGSVDEAKQRCETWMEEKATLIRSAVQAALSKTVQ